MPLPLDRDQDGEPGPFGDDKPKKRLHLATMTAKKTKMTRRWKI